MATAGGIGSMPVEYAAGKAIAVTTEIFDGLTPQSRLSLSNSMVGSWPALFRARRSPDYVAALRGLLGAAEGKHGRAETLFGADGASVVEFAAPEGFGAIKSAHLIQDEVQTLKIESMVVRAADRARGVRRFFCRTPGAPGAALLIVRGENGMLVRDWIPGGEPPSAEAWWRKSGGRDAGLREEAIALFNAHSPASRAASVEFQLRCPLKPRAIAGSESLPSARIDLALCGASGMLVGGWYRDPSDFLAGFDVLDQEDRPHSLDSGRFDFAGRIAGPNDTSITANGFVSFVPDVVRGPLQQPRFSMRLKSGARHMLTPDVQPIDWAEARAAALRVVPPLALSDDVVAQCLAPLMKEYQATASASIGAPIVKQIGTPVEKPLVSIVVPLYRVLDFLPFQVAAFASDPQVLFRSEIIYVLDSPEQADAVEHMLVGLHLVYGMAITLAVMPRNGGYAIANNRAAALARGEVIALLNSDVIPIEPGWLGMLEHRLHEKGVIAAGPKLLFEDDSIQHAGLFFARDHKGSWRNHHYYKGMPRYYAPAKEERAVPGITGACMVLRRASFEAVGGFTEDYAIGDYEDSDLCLKLRSRGGEIRYVPDAELYHLERRSMTQSADYMRGVAAQYNSWLHEQRWKSEIEALMAPAEASVAPWRNVA
jgi:GT2 family glycosyltransferase